MATSALQHVAIIIDGNGRWARRRGVPVVEGHRAGARTLTARVLDAVDLGLAQLTVYSFSTENWSRPREEVAGLLGVLEGHIAAHTVDLAERGVRIRFVGRRYDLPHDLVRRMEWAEEITAGNRAMTVFIALNYGGRAEIIDAAGKFRGRTEDEFRACLYAPEMNDPEVLIRTGGEHRISNCLLWQLAYAELVFLDELWPDFSQAMLKHALGTAAERRRTFRCREPNGHHRSS